LRPSALLRLTVALVVLGCLNELVVKPQPVQCLSGHFTVTAPLGSGWNESRIDRDGWCGLQWERGGITIGVASRVCEREAEGTEGQNSTDTGLHQTPPPDVVTDRWYEKPTELNGAPAVVAEFRRARGAICCRRVEYFDPSTGRLYRLWVEGAPFAFRSGKEQFQQMLSSFRPRTSFDNPAVALIDRASTVR